MTTGLANYNRVPAVDPVDGLVWLRRRRPKDRHGRVALDDVRGVLGLSGLALLGVIFAYAPMAGIVLAALAFCAFAYAWPVATMALILALTPIQNDLGTGGSPVRFAPAELAMFLALPAALLKVSLRPRVGPTFLPTLLYLGICVIASLDAVRPSMVVSMSQMVLYMVVAVVVFSNLEARPARLARVFDLYILSAIAIAVIGVATDFTFLGTHKNGWGASLSTALVVATDAWFTAKTRGRKLAMAVALVVIGGALMLTVSRGGWMAATVGIGIVCLVRGQFVALFRIVLLLGLVAYVAWSFIPPDLQAYAIGFESGRQNIRLRYESIDYAIAHWRKDRLLGVGVGLRKEYDATNIVLLALAETGWAGLLSFVGVHLAAVFMALRLTKRVRPDGVLFSFAALGIALLAARFTHGLVDHYWSRGPITCAWAAVGLATLAHLAVRRESIDEGRRRRALSRWSLAFGIDLDDDGSASGRAGKGRSRRMRTPQRERERERRLSARAERRAEFERQATIRQVVEVRRERVGTGQLGGVGIGDGRGHIDLDDQFDAAFGEDAAAAAVADVAWTSGWGAPIFRSAAVAGEVTSIDASVPPRVGAVLHTLMIRRRQSSGSNPASGASS